MGWMVTWEPKDSILLKDKEMERFKEDKDSEWNEIMELDGDFIEIGFKNGDPFLFEKVMDAYILRQCVDNDDGVKFNADQELSLALIARYVEGEIHLLDDEDLDWEFYPPFRKPIYAVYVMSAGRLFIQKKDKGYGRWEIYDWETKSFKDDYWYTDPNKYWDHDLGRWRKCF